MTYISRYQQMFRYPYIIVVCKAAQLWAVIELYWAAYARRRHGNPDNKLYMRIYIWNWIILR